MASALAIERQDRLCVEAIVRHLADKSASITPFKHHHPSNPLSVNESNNHRTCMCHLYNHD
jgi:hypothetical protein